jgi:hypothetical protein
MMGDIAQRIYREISDMIKPLSQSDIAKRCNCSHSFVNKEIKHLIRKRIVGKPTRTKISLINRPGLLIHWMGKREIRSMNMKIITTDLNEKEAISKLSKVTTHAFTMETAVRNMGIKENVLPDEICVYAPANEIKKLKIKQGSKGVTVVVLLSDDEHLYNTAENVKGLRIVSPAQVFVDLADWGTWTAHNAAVRMALEYDGYPLLATRQELEAFL